MTPTICLAWTGASGLPYGLRLLESLGFKREGHARERYRLGGSTQDSVLLGLLAREFRAGPASSA